MKKVLFTRYFFQEGPPNERNSMQQFDDVLFWVFLVFIFMVIFFLR